MIHTTIGVYPDGSFKINGVLTEHLKDHIDYNKKMRFGRSLFVDGKCVHKGYLDDETIKSFKKRIEKDNIKETKCTSPYI